MSFLATVGLGDYYSSMWIFGQDQKTAFTGMMDLITYVANQLETAQETEDAYRAHDYLESWIDVNRSGFSTEGILRERYGFFGSDDSANWGWCYMYPTVFDRALEEGGFNSNRVRRDWMQRKWLRPDKDGRSTVRCYDQAAGKQSRFICFKLILDDGEGAGIAAGQQMPFEGI
jgi:hypothetical protein